MRTVRFSSSFLDRPTNMLPLSLAGVPVYTT
jgi:hypothetical protein